MRVQYRDCYGYRLKTKNIVFSTVNLPLYSATMRLHTQEIQWCLCPAHAEAGQCTALRSRV